MHAEASLKGSFSHSSLSLIHLFHGRQMADIAYLENKPRQGSLDSSSEKDISLEKSDTNGGIVEVDLDLDQT